MSIIYPILSDAATSISELKKNPMAVINEADGMPVAVLNRNQPVFYCIPAKSYEAMLEMLDDIELINIIKERQNSEEIELTIDDL